MAIWLRTPCRPQAAAAVLCSPSLSVPRAPAPSRQCADICVGGTRCRLLGALAPGFSPSLFRGFLPTCWRTYSSFERLKSLWMIRLVQTPRVSEPRNVLLPFSGMPKWRTRRWASAIHPEQIRASFPRPSSVGSRDAPWSDTAVGQDSCFTGKPCFSSLPLIPAMSATSPSTLRLVHQQQCLRPFAFQNRYEVSIAVHFHECLAASSWS